MTQPCKTLEIHPEKVNEARKKLEEVDPIRLSEFFKLLSGETRIRILLALIENELCVCDLSVVLDISVSAVSHQLRQLRQSHFVKARRDGKEVYYSLEYEHLQPILLQTIEHLQEEVFR